MDDHGHLWIGGRISPTSAPAYQVQVLTEARGSWELFLVDDTSVSVPMDFAMARAGDGFALTATYANLRFKTVATGGPANLIDQNCDGH